MTERERQNRKRQNRERQDRKRQYRKCEERRRISDVFVDRYFLFYRKECERQQTTERIFDVLVDRYFLFYRKECEKQQIEKNVKDNKDVKDDRTIIIRCRNFFSFYHSFSLENRHVFLNFVDNR